MHRLTTFAARDLSMADSQPSASPETGTSPPPSSSPPSPHPALDDDGIVALDLPCVECKYNLRSRGAADACPECGTPVARTLKEQPLHLRFSDAQWLMLMRVGAIITGLVYVLGLVPVSCFWLQAGFAKIGIDDWPLLSMVTHWDRTNIRLLGVALAFPSAVGIFLLTRSEPNSPQLKLTRMTRPIARWLRIAGLCFSLWWLASLLVWGTTNMPAPEVQMQAVELRQFGKLAGWFATLALAGYIYSLLRRTDEPMFLILVMLPPALRLMNELIDVIGIARRIDWLNQLPIAATSQLILIYIMISFANRLRRAAAREAEPA